MPCPMRFGPPPRIMILSRLRRRAARTRPRRSSSSTACRPRTRPRRCRPACRRARAALDAHSRATSCLGLAPVAVASLHDRSSRSSLRLAAGATSDRRAHRARELLLELDELLACSRGTSGRSCREPRGSPRPTIPRGRPCAARRDAPCVRHAQAALEERARGVLDRAVDRPDSPAITRSSPKPETLPRLEAAQRLLQRLLERAPDRHRLADALHLRRQRRYRRSGTSRRRSAGSSRPHVVDRRLEAGRRLAW